MITRAKVQNRLLGAFLQILPQEFKRRLGVHLGVPDFRWSLRQLRRFGFAPENIMDVGAFKGEWTRACRDIFPKAQITCIEPQEFVQKHLQGLEAKEGNVLVIQTLLGRESRERVPFKDIGSGSSILLGGHGDTAQKMTTIDHLIASGICKPPELLKLDVQGFELEVLEGYTKYFDPCGVIQCEISLLPIVAGVPLLHEIIPYLFRRGFLLFDVDELIRAPSDGAVWQIDAIFCRWDSPLRAKRVWAKEG